MFLDVSLSNSPFGVFLTFAMLKVAINYVIGATARRKNKKRRVGRLSKISLFPVKSMRGIELLEASCEYDGLQAGDLRDRCYMVVDAKMNLLSARKCSKLASILVTVDSQYVKLLSPDDGDQVIISHNCTQNVILHVCLWEDTIEAYDCGPKVSAWLDRVLGKSGLRLVYHAVDMHRRRCVDMESHYHAMCKPEDKVAFQDGFPYMLMSTSSVDDLNTRLQMPVSINNFRPNLVIDGSIPYDEDTWDKIYIGDVTFTNMKPCARCIMTTVNPETGKRDGDMQPLRTLRKYRTFKPDFVDSPAFGINLVVDKPGIIQIDSDVYATFK